MYIHALYNSRQYGGAYKTTYGKTWLTRPHMSRVTKNELAPRIELQDEHKTHPPLR